MKTRKFVLKSLPGKASEPFLAEIIPILFSILRLLFSLLFGGGMLIR